MRPGMSVRPPPSMTVASASTGVSILPLDTRSMMFPRTITLPGSVSFSALPSKIRTFLNRVTATLGTAVAVPAAGLAAGDDTVWGGAVVAVPVAPPPASDPDGAPDGAQPAESMSATTAPRSLTFSRMEASLRGLLVVVGPFSSQRSVGRFYPESVVSMTLWVFVKTWSRSIGLDLVVPALGARNAHPDA